MVLMKISMLIHKMADWLERKYLSQNTVSALARLPWYALMASKDRPAATTMRACKGRQNQHSATVKGKVASKMPCS